MGKIPAGVLHAVFCCISRREYIGSMLSDLKLDTFVLNQLIKLDNLAIAGQDCYKLGLENVRTRAIKLMQTIQKNYHLDST